MSPGWDAAALHGVEKDFNVSCLCCCLPFVLGGITADIDREDWTFAPESRITVIRNHRRGILWIEPSPAMGEGLEGGTRDGRRPSGAVSVPGPKAADLVSGERTQVSSAGLRGWSQQWQRCLDGPSKETPPGGLPSGIAHGHDEQKAKQHRKAWKQQMRTATSQTA